MRKVQRVSSVPAIAVRAVAAAAAVLLGLTPAWTQQISGALSQKSPEAAEILSLAQRDGNVRVVVTFDSPVHPGQIKPEPASIADIKTRMKALRDAIVARHFGNAANPRPGQGFASELTHFDITTGFATNVTQAELAALAQHPSDTSSQ